MAAIGLADARRLVQWSHVTEHVAPEGNGSFGLYEHWPRQNEQNIDFAGTVIRVQFTTAYDRRSVNDSTFAVGYLNEQLQFVLVDGTFRHHGDGVTLYFEPHGELLDHIRYRVRIKGGPAGLLSRTGEQMVDDYEWGFWTYPDFGQHRSTIAAASSLPLSSYFVGAGYLGLPTHSDGASVMTPGLYSDCASTDTPEYTEPVIHVSVYQTICNAPLVEGKRTAIRIYALWKRHEGEVNRLEDAERLYTTVQVFDDSRRAVTPSMRFTFTRPDRETFDRFGIQTDLGQHTANFADWFPTSQGARTSFSPLRAMVTPETGILSGDGPQFGARSFHFLDCGGGCLRRPASRAPELDFSVHLPLIGAWSAQIPSRMIETAALGTWAASRFTLETTPLKALTMTGLPSHDRIPEPATAEFGPYCHDTQGAYFCEAYGGRDAYAALGLSLPTDGTEPDPMPMYAFLHHWYKPYWESSDAAPVIVVPEDVDQDDWYGLNTGVLGDGIVVLAYDAVSSDRVFYVMAHEFGHLLGLSHCRTFPLQGLRLVQSTGEWFVKDQHEGNGDSRSPNDVTTGVMDYAFGWPPDWKGKFMPRRQYEELLRNVVNMPRTWSPYANDCDHPMPIRRQSSTGNNVSSGRFATGHVAGHSTRTGAPSALFHGVGGDPIPPRVSLSYWPEGSSPTAAQRLLGSVQTPSGLLVDGIIRSDGNHAALLPLKVVESPTDSSNTAGPYWVVQRDAFGNVVYRFGFDPVMEPLNAFVSDSAGLHFTLRIPLAPGLVTLEIRNPRDQVIGSLNRSPGVPQLSITRPAPGDVWRGPQRVTWSASDPDGDRLTYSVFYSPNGTAGWIPVGLNISGTGVTVETTRLPPGPSPTLLVTATDGFNETQATVAFGLSNDLHVIGYLPSDGDTVHSGTSFDVRFPSPIDTTQSLSSVFVVRDGSGVQVRGTVVHDESARVLRFVPTSRLYPSEDYVATVIAGVQDTYGSLLPTDRTWTVSVEPDMLPPRVLRTSPDSYALTIYPEDHVVVEFSEDMDPASITASSFFLRDRAGQRIPGVITYDSITRSATLAPDSLLTVSTVYDVTVDSTVTDRAGNGLSRPFSWYFTTVGNLRPSRRN